MSDAGIVVLLATAIAVAGGVLLVRFVRMRRERAQAQALRAASDSDAAKIATLESALAQRAAQLEAVTRELEAFSYSVSHDLRAPLRHISGYVQLLVTSTEGKLDDESRRYLEVVAHSSRNMGELIDDLLSFSRTAHAEMREVPVAPRAVAESALAGLAAVTQDRNIEWRISDMPHVCADPLMLRIVYENLIGNAIKFSAPKDPALIEIGAGAEESGRIVLYVRDNGVGFDMAYADRLFGIFQRLHRAQDFEGTGIGLATVQRIVARHGGRAWAHAAPGEGATFCFTLAKPVDKNRTE
ncbi:MAG: sensor histidine kinase [Betaproteobacteria bacterium]|nr:sensor histidine kinase [Betaproteobacteria bacterium]